MAWLNNGEDPIARIKREVPITDLAQSLGYTLVQKGSYLSLKEHDSVMIDPQQNYFYRNSVITSGNHTLRGDSIDFYMHFTGESDKKQAIRVLLGKTGYIQSFHDSSITETAKKKRKERDDLPPFSLPEPSKGAYKRTFRYLLGRGINREVIQDMVKRHYLYEEAEHHNAVFVGYGKDGNPAYYFSKGTNPDYPFAGDPYQCRFDKGIGIFINNHAKSLVISEAAVDALSVMSLMQEKGNDFNRHSHLAMCGNNLASVKYWLPKMSPSQIITATDNDRAGDNFRKSIREIAENLAPDAKVYDRVPANKDFNDDLKQLKGIGRFAREKQNEPEPSMME